MAINQCSIVEYFAEHEGYRCGYCKSADTNYSHGLWAHSMTVQDYQDLIDRGWRRSGKYCYKPTMNMTCCPQYTIKCDAVQFKLSKSQKNVLKRMNKFLRLGMTKETQGLNFSETDMSKTDSAISDIQIRASETEQKLSFKETPVISTYKSPSSHAHCSEQVPNLEIPQRCVSEINTTISSMGMKEGKKLPKPGTGPDPSKPPCKKAKLLRLERRAEKLKQESEHRILTEAKDKMKQNVAKSLEDFLSESVSEDACHKLEIQLIRSNPQSKYLIETLEESYSIYNKYQQTIHKDPPEKCKLSQFKRFLVESPLEISLVHVSSNCDEFTNTLEDSFLLYQKYQMAVHSETPDECDRDSYFNFLVKSPFEKFRLPEGPSSGYGSFHQQYRLDGKLIAVGVLDVLPNCVSSVYFYYDPDYSFLSLGTYASLRELAFTRELEKHHPELCYYYMGFYIHSCPKMRYKGNYYPSFLLCPETYTWHSIESCIPKLDKAKYSRFEVDKTKEDKNVLLNIDEVLILHRHEAMPYYAYRFLKPEKNDEADVRQYSKFVGAKCAKRMLLYRS